ncbi:MAG: T9SS type A sorting domain-containing protein, partial [Ignavibacteria bacterium]
ANGVAAISTTTLGIGTHLIRAYYGGTANFDSSSSNIITQVIRPDSFAIIATAGLNGLIAPSGALLVARGSTQQFSITPNIGYHLDSLLVDGSRVDSTASYTFFGIGANHRIRAVFAINTYTITATAGPNGTVTPSGTLIVDWGTSQSFAITGNTGFKVSNVLVDGVSVGRVTTYAFNNITSDHTVSATFEVSYAYSNRYRSFSADSIPFERDNRGKLGRYVFRKPDKVEFIFVVRNDSAGVNGLHAEFGVAIDTSLPFFTLPHSAISTTDVKMKKWNFTFDTLLTLGEQVRVAGFGKSPKLQSVSAFHWTKQGIPTGRIHHRAFFSRNMLKLPMPNRVNALAESFAYNGFGSTGGLLVGKDRSLDSASRYGWFLAPKYTNVLRTLSDATGLHTGTPRGFEVFQIGTPIRGKQTELAPAKFNDILLADMIALKLNIVASELEQTPIGFGELIYNDGTLNPLNGMMIREIAHYGDSVMMGYYSGGAHVFHGPSTYQNLEGTIRNINIAFEGPIDTVSFSDTLRFKATRSLAEIPYLRSNFGVVPSRIQPVQVLNLDAPARYKLYQNYPNPFNPTTTIEFNLSNPAIVALKVYNVVGQEIATLIDNQRLEDGDQTVQFNGSNLPSGVYFYTIIAQQLVNADDGIGPDYFRTTKKMMLIK